MIIPILITINHVLFRSILQLESHGFAVRVRQVSISEEQFEAFMEAARAGLMGISMGGFVAFHWDFMGISWDSMGFHADFMGISWLFFIGFNGDLMCYATNISDLGLLKSRDDTDEGFRGSHIPIDFGDHYLIQIRGKHLVFGGCSLLSDKLI